MATNDESRPATISELQLVQNQLNARIEDLPDQLNSRIDDLQKMMLWGMGLLAALIIALMGVVLSGI